MPNTIAETIAENLQRLVNAKNAIANAITEKGGTVASSDGLEDFASDIATIPCGSGNVNFYDYDGTLVQSYTRQQFLALQSMPANPTHEGLTAQGWNWELAAAKAYVEANDSLNIGQTYITSDGKTRIYVYMEDGRLNPQLNLTFAEAGSFTVDWGDGTTPDTISGNTNTLGTIAHTYTDPGDYVIAVTVNSGKVSIIGIINSYTQLFKKASKRNYENRVYSNCIRAINLGNGIISIGSAAFYYCYSLTSITIPNGVTSIGDQAFGECYSLKSITIPSGVTSIGTSAFWSCYSLTSIMMPSGVTSIERTTFQNCYSLTSITIPNGVTSIGYNAFYYCYSLVSVTIPSGVTSIGHSAFQNCYSLKSIIIPNGVISIGRSAFQNCFSLALVTIPSSVISIEINVFQNCCSLTSITIPSEVTSIEDSTFDGCYSLTSITIPNRVTRIGNWAIRGCYGLGYLKFISDTPPTATSMTFSNIPTDCIIYVPAGKLEAYTTARYYPNSRTYTYQEYTPT